MKKTISFFFAIAIIIGCAVAAFLIVYSYDLIPRIGEESGGSTSIILKEEKEKQDEQSGKREIYNFSSLKPVEEVVSINVIEQISDDVLQDLRKKYGSMVSNTLEGWAAEIDVQEDGIKEYIIFPNGLLRGASGNGPIYILLSHQGNWKIVLTAEGNVLIKEGEKNGGYYNFGTSWHLGAEEHDYCIYKWDESEMLYSVDSCKSE